jgi:hypothetical protein
MTSRIPQLGGASSMHWVKVGQCRAEALFKKQQQLHDGQQAKAEYQTELPAMQQRTPRLRCSDWLTMRGRRQSVKRTRSGLTLRTSHTTINGGRVVVRSFPDTSC